MGDDYRFREVRTGRGQANLGHGNTNIGRDHIDNRGGRYAGRDYRDERRYVRNHGMYAEGNLHYRDGDNYDIQVGPGDPFDAIAGGRGVGRLIAAFGMAVALAGFGLWIWVIFTLISEVGPGVTGPPSLFDLEVRGIPAAPLGFGAVAVGAVVAAIGAAMSRAAKRRHQEAQRRHRRGF
jgi:hypothetical protein